MKCPRCGNEKTYVTGGENCPTGYRRFRKCRKCLKKFATIEEYAGIYSPQFKRRYHSTAATPTDNSTTKSGA